MLQITPHHRILLAIQHIDFRKGIDGLVAACQKELNQDAFTGTVFVFANRRRTNLKLLVYDGNGYWLCQKRFSSGKLSWWPKTNQATHILHAAELHILLAQGCPDKAELPPDWRRIDHAA